MKIHLLKATILATALLACSCNDENEKQPTPGGEDIVYENTILDSERMRDCHVYPMNEGELAMLKRYPGYFDMDEYGKAKDYYDEAARKFDMDEPMQYGNLRLLFQVGTASVTYDEENTPTEEELNRLKALSSLEQRVTRSIMPTMEQRERVETELAKQGTEGKFVGLEPLFFTARLKGGMTITADKTLFGLQPGENLSSHFRAEAPCLCLPTGTLGDFTFLYTYDDKERPDEPDKLLAADTWLQPGYAFRLFDEPEEAYDEIAFSISIPVTCDHWYNYYRYAQSEVEHRDRLLSVTCKVRPGQPSDFRMRFEEYKAENSQIGWW